MILGNSSGGGAKFADNNTLRIATVVSIAAKGKNEFNMLLLHVL